MACLAILAALIWLGEMNFTEIRDALNSVSYDLSTTTVGDYTVEIKLSETVW